MNRKGIQVGDLVCFEGDEEDFYLGVGLVMDTKGDLENLADLDTAIKGFYDDDEFWRISHILPAAPMVLVLWSRTPTQESANFELYKIDKLSYSFMWVYPTEVKVISSLGSKDGK